MVQSRSRKPFNPVRGSNAIAAGLVCGFFLIHATLGTCAVLAGWRGSFPWAIWVGAAVIGVHVALSIATTYYMFTDTERPASSRKRRHQWFKWATGSVIVAVVAWHVSGAQALLGAPDAAGVLAAIAAVVALAWHAWVGTKSLTRDLRIAPAFRAPIRVVCVVVAALLSIALLARMVLS